jgi:acyl-CoA thioesterase FadM
VGASAVQLTTWLAAAGNILLETRQVLVFVELDDKKIRTVRIPEALRERIRAQLAASATT